ncbi:MAG TPA: hypothetical protein VGT02_07775 [Methylomirabilota bacterium]|nr:hypothetical protein [Methylomirabilota bacterium]
MPSAGHRRLEPAAAPSLQITPRQTDGARVFVTALLVYLLFWNPWLQFSNSDNFVDAAVSFVDTGRWELVHWRLYEGKDTATARDGRVVPGVPPGTAAAIVPLYGAWRAAGGARVTGWAGLEAVNAVAILLLCAPAMALTAVQVGWLAGWLGATRRGRVLAALLFAFGTQAFQFGTMLAKESLTALAITTALRLALDEGGAGRRAAAGALASAAVLLHHSVAPLPVLLGLVVVARHGVGAAGAFVAGGVPGALALGAYDTWLFGAPWRTSYSAITGLDTRFVTPKPAIVADFLVGPRGGLVLYAPFLLAAGAGLAAGWRGARRSEAALTAVFLAVLLTVGVSWQSQFADRASWSHGLGARYLFPALPLLAAFAGPVLERLGPRALALLAVPSLVCGYLGAQAGFAPVPNALPYALKTFVSGTGMSVLFKEALPAWTGLETLHTMVARPEVSARDLLARLPSPEGLQLALHQVLFLALNAAALLAVWWVIARLWRPRALEVPACAS